MIDKGKIKEELKNETLRLYALQVTQLYKHIPIGLVATLVNSLILTFVLWKVIQHSVLITWFSANALISLLRYLLFLKFSRSSQTSAETDRWGMWFTVSLALSGVVWGSAGIFLFPVDSIAHQMFLAFVLGGMVAGAVGTYSVIIRSFLAYSLPALIPIIIRFLVIGEGIHLAMGGMILLFGVLMFSTAKRINAVTLSSLKLQFENSDLIQHLAAEKDRIEKLNEDYLSEINERKRSEDALLKSEELLRSTLESTADGILVVNEKGQVTHTNKRFAQMWRIPDELIKKKDDKQLLDFVINQLEDPETFLAKVQDLYASSKEDFDILFFEDNRVFERFSSSLIQDGEIVGRVWSFRDITKKNQAKEALKLSEEKHRELYAETKKAEEVYRSLLHSSADAIVIYDLEERPNYISPAFTQIFGWTLEEVEGKRIPFLPESERESTMATIKGLVENGTPCHGFETKRDTKDGRLLDVSLSASRYDDNEGKPAGILVILRDTTEKKKLEAQLQQAQKMEALGTLAGGVAHDLNNILSGIVGYPDLLLMQIPEDSPLKKPILSMQASGKKAAAIVHDLLTLARRGVVTKDVMNLNDIISEYLKSPEHEKLKLFHPGIEVGTNLEEDLLNISGSPVHLSKTVMNLVSNAAEAMTDGGKVLISTENRYIDRPISGYESVKEGDYIAFRVSDTGTGISSEDIGKIFEPFYTKKKMGRSGTGLGMAVVWGTVKDHEGYVDIQSTEGKGTTFILYFPVTRQEIAKEKSLLSIDDYTGKGESILVVDDVKEQREIAFTMLTTLGYAADAVSSGEEAVEYLKEHAVDLIVLDMIMAPGMDGLETYRKILEMHPGQKTIIASGFSETGRVKEAQRLGAGVYVRKPYSLEKIGIAVKTELVR